MADAPAFAPSLPMHPRHRNQTLNAVSFGFIATAVLFAMFLVMAVFERLLRPHRLRAPSLRDAEQQVDLPPGPSESQKVEVRHGTAYLDSVSVLMPGQDYPTYFARPIPSPTAPDAVQFPTHAESSQHTQTQSSPFYGNYITDSTEKGATSEKGGTTSS